MNMTTHHEIERKYEVDERAMVPPLHEIATVMPKGEVSLDAEYFDTEGGDLAAERIVLRRRTGGSDEGWHVKMPAAEGRTELHWPLTSGEVPREVRDSVSAVVRDRELRVIARMHTQRNILHLLGAEGKELVEVADDLVSASDVNTGILRIWREWEVELLGGAPESGSERNALLDAVEERLVLAGATPAASASKLASALGRTALGEDPSPAAPLTRSSRASEVLVVAVSQLVDELKRLDPIVRADEPDSVHQLRTRIRRLRSVLASYRRVFDRSVTDPIRDELQHLGLVLGEARDAEVMRDRARSLVADHESVPRSVGDELAAGWDERYRAAHDRVIAELSRERYFRLLDMLDEFVARPVLAGAASDSVATEVPRALRGDLKRVLRRAKRADAAASELERIPLLHETRKAAKRLRYAAEAVSQGDASVFGKKVRRLASAAEAVHDLLGEHRDSVLMQQHLYGSAGSGSHPFHYGVLHEVERHGAALCLADYPAALAALKRFQ